MTPNKGDRKKAKKDQTDKDVYLQEIVIIDPVMGWIEINFLPEATVDLVINQVELAWLTRCLLPTKIIVDRCKELLVES